MGHPVSCGSKANLACASPRINLLWTVEEWEELPFDLFAGWDYGHALQQGFVACRAYTILHHVNDRRAARTIGMIGKRSMYQPRMMESRFAFFQLNRDRVLKLTPLFFA